jgi:thioredoxin-dependent peroxiredoxin
MLKQIVSAPPSYGQKLLLLSRLENLYFERKYTIMASIKLKGTAIRTSGHLPSVGSPAPRLRLVKSDLSEATLDNYSGKKKILNIFPSIDTGTCATSLRKFNEKAPKVPGVVVLNISRDLPFAQKRFCGAEGLEGVEALSCFNSNFGADWGLEIQDGPLAGLCSRAVVVLDENNVVLYTEQVEDIVDEPDYEAALKMIL